MKAPAKQSFWAKLREVYNPYEKQLSHFLSEERLEILRGFMDKHRDFRDSVQMPKVFTAIGVLLFGGFGSALRMDLNFLQYLAAIVLISGVSYTLGCYLFVHKNQAKLDAYLNELASACDAKE
ncbi:MAG: hypothetical protein AAGF10_01105 [Verrucomicrobiota bacterium]